MQCLSGYMTAFGEHKLSCTLASAAVDMATNVWGPEDLSTYRVMKVKIDCLSASLRIREALRLSEEALNYLCSNAALSSLSKFEILQERYLITYHMCEILCIERDWPNRVEREYDMLKLLEEGKRAWNDQLAEDNQEHPVEWGKVSSFVAQMKLLASSNGRYTLEDTHKFRLARALISSGKTEEALRVTELMLNEHTPETVHEEDITKLEALPTLKECLTDGGVRFSRVHKHLAAFKESLSDSGIKSPQTWKAANSVLPCLTLFTKDVAETWTALLDAALEPGVYLPRRSDIGNFLDIMGDTMRLANHWIEHLIGEGNVEAAGEFSQKLQRVRKDFARGIDLPNYAESYDLMNHRGASLQKQRHFKDAEEAHRTAISQAEAAKETRDYSWYHYNLMLAVARQGRLEEACKYRIQHMDIISKEERTFGTLESRLEKDRKDKATYDEAAARLLREGSHNDGPWWEESKEALHRAELRYGKLEKTTAT
jgi:tetratricopeptide (TPR) repeat protein